MVKRRVAPVARWQVPNNLATSMLKQAYDAGARIHSDSWGSTTPTYTAYARQARPALPSPPLQYKRVLEY